MKLLHHRTTLGLLPVMLSPLTDEYQEENLAMKLIKDKNYFRSEGGSEKRIKIRISPHTNGLLVCFTHLWPPLSTLLLFKVQSPVLSSKVHGMGAGERRAVTKMAFFSLMKYFKVHLELMANLLQTLNFLRTRMMEDEQVHCLVTWIAA